MGKLSKFYRQKIVTFCSRTGETKQAFFSKNYAQDTQWGAQSVWQRELREAMGELQLVQVTVHMLFRPHKPTCKSHVCTFPCLVLRVAQTSDCTWRGSWLLPTALRCAPGGPLHRYFLWDQSFRPDHINKNYTKRAALVHFSVLPSVQLTPQFKLELTQPLQQPCQLWASGQLWLQSLQAAHRAQAVNYFSVWLLQGVIHWFHFLLLHQQKSCCLNIYLSHSFLTHVSASNNCQLSFCPFISHYQFTFDY